MSLLAAGATATLMGACGSTGEREPKDSEESYNCGTNSWPRGEPPLGTSGETGYIVGATVPDHRLRDQFGDEVCAWQFAGRVQVLHFRQMWSHPCQSLSSDAQEIVNEFAAMLVFQTIIAENLEMDTPSTEDLEEFVQYYGLEAPVLADEGAEYTGRVVDLLGGNSAVLVVNADLHVHWESECAGREELESVLLELIEAP